MTSNILESFNEPPWLHMFNWGKDFLEINARPIAKDLSKGTMAKAVENKFSEENQKCENMLTTITWRSRRAIDFRQALLWDSRHASVLSITPRRPGRLNEKTEQVLEVDWCKKVVTDIREKDKRNAQQWTDISTRNGNVLLEVQIRTGLKSYKLKVLSKRCHQSTSIGQFRCSAQVSDKWKQTDGERKLLLSRRSTRV